MQVPADFYNVNNIKDFNATRDPRHVNFFEDYVEVDLSLCRRIEPPALMWCLTYPLVVHRRAMKVVVRLPEDPVVLNWLYELGLPEILSSNGITLEHTATRPIRQGLYVVLPLTCFRTTSEAEGIVAVVSESLARLGFGSANVRPLVGQILSELALNAADHADSAVNAYGFVQFYRRQHGDVFVCAVSDGGIGVRESLAKNPDFRRIPTDAAAIDLAMEERVSSKRDTNRGIGLHWIRQELSGPGGQLSLHSMRAVLSVGDGAVGRARGARLFPGTEVVAWIPT